jgi:hypothetical protein
MSGEEAEATQWQRLVLPVLVLLVIVAIVAGLVLGGVVEPRQTRPAPEQLPTTVPTVEIAP